MIDRLSPNIAPPTTAPTQRGRDRSLTSVSPKAIGVIAAMVPIDVPIAVAINAVITNRPGRTSCAGIKLRPKLTVASTPPTG